MWRLSGEIRPQAERICFMGELLPLDGWLTVELHCHLDGAEPSGRHPDLTQVLLSVPPPEGHGLADPRVEALTDYISRVTETGAGTVELEHYDPGRAALYQNLAEALVPWMVAVPERELKDAWDRGYEAARRRSSRKPRQS